MKADRVHRSLVRTPAPLVAQRHGDFAGEREPIILPGISTRRHPSRSRRLTRPLAEITFDPLTLAGRAQAIEAGSPGPRSQDGAP